MTYFQTGNSWVVYQTFGCVTFKCESNRKINRLHERCLRTICNDKQSSFDELLEKDGSVSIHERNFQVLLTEMYKISNDLSTPLMKDVFSNKHKKSL